MCRTILSTLWSIWGFTNKTRLKKIYCILNLEKLISDFYKHAYFLHFEVVVGTYIQVYPGSVWGNPVLNSFVARNS